MRDATWAILFLFVCTPLARADNWPAWRGPTADGIAPDGDYAVEWDEKRNIVWKAPLGGHGTSTPIIWGDRVFVTMQMGDGPFEQRGRDFANAVAARRTGERATVRFAVQAYDRRTGKLLWEHALDADGALQPVHAKHNLASPSCVTDGERVYAWFGTGQLVVLTMDGKVVWQRSLGRDFGHFQILWGHGSSPLLYRNSLILLCDHQGSAYILALDKKSGKQIWKIDRGADRRSYTTPFIVRGKDRDEMIVNSSERIDAYDPATGEQLWHAGEPNRVPVPTPVFHDGILYASRGYNSSPYMALHPGGKGDVSASHVKWEHKTGAPYVSSILYYKGLLWMASETGIVTCIDAADGKTLWKERFGGVFSASPVAANGRVYIVNEDGDAFVLEASREMKVVARNKLPERTLASPALAGGQIFLRTDLHLVCIEDKSRRASAR